MRRLDIDKDQLIKVLISADVDGIEPNAEIYCEDILICKTQEARNDHGWEVSHIACAHPYHGVHKRFKDIPVIENLKSKECPVCNDGWLDAKSELARKQIIMGRTIGMYRGIILAMDKEIP